MNERTPVSAYGFLSSPCNKSIVFVSSGGTPCTYVRPVRTEFKKPIKIGDLRGDVYAPHKINCF